MIIVGPCFRVQTDRTSIELPFRESVASVQSRSWFVHGRCPLTGILIPASPDFRRQVEFFPIVLSRFSCVNSPSRENCLLFRPRRNARHDDLTVEHYRNYAGDPLTLRPYEGNGISRDNYAPKFEPGTPASPPQFIVTYWSFWESALNRAPKRRMPSLTATSVMARGGAATRFLPTTPTTADSRSAGSSNSSDQPTAGC